MTKSLARKELLSWVDGILPGSESVEDSEERMRQRLLVVFGILLFSFTMPWFVLQFIRDPVPRIPRVIAVATFSILAANVLWLRVLPSRAVAWMTVGLVHFGVITNVVLNGGLQGPVALVIPSLPVLAATLLGPRIGWIDGGCVGLGAGLLEFFSQTIQLPIIAPPEIWPLVRMMALMIGLAIMLLPISTYVDLSKRRSQELAQALEDATAASRAKSRFLSMVSHELRTPMVGAVGAIEILRRSQLRPEQRELMAALEESASAQLEIIGNVLDLARIEADEFSIELRAVSPRETLSQIETLFRIPCETKGLELQIKIDQRVPQWISADGPRIRQVISNLVNNAIKFTEQGSITIQATILDAGEQERLEISVADTGIGFDSGLRDQIFGAFRQADESTTRRFGGTGLGLAISRGLAEAMGGSISAQSSPGQGACFRFELAAPLTEPACEDSREEPSATAAKALNILVADDEPINRLILAAMLSELGHTAVEAEDGRQAATIACQGFVDLIVLDMHMPVLDGPACARYIRSLAGPAANLPILGLTADALAENQARFLASGLDAVYTKPIDLRRLEQAISATVSAASLVRSEF